MKQFLFVVGVFLAPLSAHSMSFSRGTSFEINRQFYQVNTRCESRSGQVLAVFLARCLLATVSPVQYDHLEGIQKPQARSIKLFSLQNPRRPKEIGTLAYDGVRGQSAKVDLLSVLNAEETNVGYQIHGRHNRSANAILDSGRFTIYTTFYEEDLGIFQNSYSVDRPEQCIVQRPQASEICNEVQQEMSIEKLKNLNASY